MLATSPGPLDVVLPLPRRGLRVLAPPAARVGTTRRFEGHHTECPRDAGDRRHSGQSTVRQVRIVSSSTIINRPHRPQFTQRVSAFMDRASAIGTPCRLRRSGRHSVTICCANAHAMSRDSGRSFPTGSRVPVSDRTYSRSALRPPPASSGQARVLTQESLQPRRQCFKRFGHRPSHAVRADSHQALVSSRSTGILLNA
jgi:hypothetical protein